jgi:hypothetical protein
MCGWTCAEVLIFYDACFSNFCDTMALALNPCVAALRVYVALINQYLEDYIKSSLQLDTQDNDPIQFIHLWFGTINTNINY